MAPKTSGTSIRRPESSSSLGCDPAGAQSLLEGHLAHLGTWLLCCHGLKSPPIQGFGAGHSPREANCLCRARRDCSLVRSSFTVSSMWLALSELSAVTVCWGARGRHTRAAPWLGLVPAGAPGSQGGRTGCNRPQIVPRGPPARFGILLNRGGKGRDVPEAAPWGSAGRPASAPTRRGAPAPSRSRSR